VVFPDYYIKDSLLPLTGAFPCHFLLPNPIQQYDAEVPCWKHYQTPSRKMFSNFSTSAASGAWVCSHVVSLSTHHDECSKHSVLPD
jgi:hypothetical protein